MKAVSVARKMAGKKGAVVQLQTEVNTDEEWQKLLQKQGLIVVDVYSDWCGPCVGMTGNLKKIKLDIGGDLLHLATAKADNIESLKRFRNKSEPTWMFIGSGHLVNLMFGANAPRLSKLITAELAKESAVLKGEQERDELPFDQLTPEERVRFEAAEKIRLAELAEKEAAIAKAKEVAHQKLIDVLVDELKDSTVVVYMPFTCAQDEGTCTAHIKLMESLLPHGMHVKEDLFVDINYLMASKLFDGGTCNVTEEWEEELKTGKYMVKLLEIKRKSIPQPDNIVEGEPVPVPPVLETEPDPLEVVVNAVYGCPLPPAGDTQEVNENSLVKQYCKSDIPGIWTPSSRRSKAEVMTHFFPKYIEEFAQIESEPLPPHLALAFKATAMEDMVEVLSEYHNEIIEMGIFDQIKPDRIQQIGSTPEHYYNLSVKSGKERLVLILDNTDSDALLTLSQYAPVYISPSVEVGATDYKNFFPPCANNIQPELIENFPCTLMSGVDNVTSGRRNDKDATPSKDPSTNDQQTCKGQNTMMGENQMSSTLVTDSN